MPHSCKRPSCFAAFYSHSSGIGCLDRQRSSPYPFPADIPIPLGCPVALPMLCLAEGDSRGKYFCV